ncbi:MAG: bactofilin family protein, partial [Actinomycetes bacterium]
MTVRSSLRLLVVPIVAGLALLTTAAPALAQQDTTEDNPIVVVTGRADVLPTTSVDGILILDGPVFVAGTSTSDVFAANGNVAILGRVNGDVVALNGDVRVVGEVTGDIAATNGRVQVLPTGRVQGDVESSEQPQVAPGAQVGGTVEKTDFAARFQSVGWAAMFAWWLGVTLLTLVAGLVMLYVFPRATDAAVRTGRTSVGRSVVAGLIVGIVLPIVATLVFFTLVGIPLAMSVLLGFAVLLPVAYAVTAALLGGLVVKRSRIGGFLLGWGVLRLLALVPGLGALILTLANLYGIGALTMAALRSGRGQPRHGQPAS